MVTRPPAPEPVMPPMSTPCSLAMRRTSGDERWPRPSAASATRRQPAPRPAEAAPRAGPRRPSGISVAAAAGLAERPPAAATAAAPAPIVATTLWIGTVSPSFTAMSSSTPAAGDGISASTLSVEISKSGSSRSTASPTFLIQRTIVPSAIDSPIWGITTGVDMDGSFSRRRDHQIDRTITRSLDPITRSPDHAISDVNRGAVGGVRRLAHGFGHRRDARGWSSPAPPPCIRGAARARPRR